MGRDGVRSTIHVVVPASSPPFRVPIQRRSPPGAALRLPRAISSPRRWRSRHDSCNASSTFSSRVLTPLRPMGYGGQADAPTVAWADRRSIRRRGGDTAAAAGKAGRTLCRCGLPRGRSCTGVLPRSRLLAQSAAGCRSPGLRRPLRTSPISSSVFSLRPLRLCGSLSPEPGAFHGSPDHQPHP